MSRIKVSAVSYTNTKPFVYGLEHSGIMDEIDLMLDIPSDCARKLIDNKTDIGLIPVAALLNIPGYKIVSDFCIGANGAVNSVFIFSTKPIGEVKTVRLDLQSRTSNALARILLKEFWKIDIVFSDSTDTDAYVEIGDRTFGKAEKVPFAYDLAEAWKSFTGLPFAFAVWASHRELEPAFIARFNEALSYGLEHRPELLRTLPTHPEIDLEDYLLHKIDYALTADKKEAINLFLSYLKQIYAVST